MLGEKAVDKSGRARGPLWCCAIDFLLKGLSPGADLAFFAHTQSVSSSNPRPALCAQCEGNKQSPVSFQQTLEVERLLLEIKRLRPTRIDGRRKEPCRTVAFYQDLIYSLRMDVCHTVSLFKCLDKTSHQIYAVVVQTLHKILIFISIVVPHLHRQMTLTGSCDPLHPSKL